MLFFFYDKLRVMNAMIPASTFLTPYGDCNDYGDSTGSGYKEVHGSCGYAKPDPDIEAERILEYASAYDMLICKTCLKSSHYMQVR